MEAANRRMLVGSALVATATVGLNARVGRAEDAFDDAELRARAAAVRAEWRADEDAWTRAAYEQFEHGRTLVDVARDCMHRGDRVALAVGDATFTGVVTSVGPDTARVQVGADPGDVVDVHLGAAVGVVLRVDAHPRHGGTRGTGDVGFRARALEREDDAEVHVGIATPPLVLTGRLRVGRDHVRIVSVDGTTTHAALAAVSWIRRAPG
jgi:hypothetical protein